MSVELLPGDQAGFNGPMRVTVNGLTGRICANNWTDSAANTVCRQLGANGGKAYQLTSLVSICNQLTNVILLLTCGGSRRAPPKCAPSLTSPDSFFLTYKFFETYLYRVGTLSPARWVPPPTENPGSAPGDSFEGGTKHKVCERAYNPGTPL